MSRLKCIYKYTKIFRVLERFKAKVCNCILFPIMSEKQVLHVYEYVQGPRTVSFSISPNFESLCLGLRTINTCFFVF